MLTKVFENNFKGVPMFSIFEVNEDGEKLKKFDPNTGQPVDPKPLVNIGFKKANLTMKHSEELAAFTVENNKQ